MDRRTFLFVFAVGALSAPLAVYAQQPVKIPRIGVFFGLANSQRRDAFRQGLIEHGWMEGKNIVVE